MHFELPLSRIQQRLLSHTSTFPPNSSSLWQDANRSPTKKSPIEATPNQPWRLPNQKHASLSKWHTKLQTSAPMAVEWAPPLTDQTPAASWCRVDQYCRAHQMPDLKITFRLPHQGAMQVTHDKRACNSVGKVFTARHCTLPLDFLVRK